MKGRIWILTVILLVAAIGVGIGAGILISNSILQKAEQAQEDAEENRDARRTQQSEREDEDEENEAAAKSVEEPAAEEAVDSQPNIMERNSEEEAAEEAPPQPTKEEENIKAHAGYADILTYIHDHPTEFVQGFAEDPMDDIEYNSFAVADINDDGIDELIVAFTNTFMAGMYARVYTWDEAAGQTTEYAEWVSAYSVFYHGEYLQEMAGHNQGPSSIWPYSVSKYDPETKTYQYLFSASSVSEALDESHAYYHPEDDLDQDGVIYHIYPADFDYSTDPEPYTEEAFWSYINAYIPEVNVIDMTYLPLSMDNINALR